MFEYPARKTALASIEITSTSQDVLFTECHMAG
jgi:hypothetical protein